MIIYADVGGTKTRVWKKGRGKVSELIIGLRGVWTPAEKSACKRKLRKLAPTITVLSDIELAHHLAFGNGPGIVLNAGTGSIAFGRNSLGKTARAGGLGPLLGDEGSAFWIGREYLRRHPGMFLSGITEENGRVDVRDPSLRHAGMTFVIPRKYVTGASAVKNIAALAKFVLLRAKRNPRSPERKIVNQAQAYLRDLIAEVRKKLGQKNSPPVHLTGGLFEDPFFKKSFKRLLRRSRFHV